MVAVGKMGVKLAVGLVEAGREVTLASGELVAPRGILVTEKPGSLWQAAKPSKTVVPI